MTRTVQAKFDGQPEGNGDRAPVPGEPYSFLKLAMQLNLDGPEDWSENLEEYFYGEPGFQVLLET